MSNEEARKRAKDNLYRALFRLAAGTVDEGSLRQLVADLRQAELGPAGGQSNADVDDVVTRVCARIRALLLAEAEEPRDLADLAAALMALDAGEHRALARHIVELAGTETDPYSLTRPAIELTTAMLDVLRVLGATDEGPLEDLTPKVFHA